MGRRAKLKQANPTPLPGSGGDRSSRHKGKKKASSSAPNLGSLKSSKKVKVAKAKGGRVTKRQVDKVDEDSDIEDAMRPGELSESEDDEETVKVKSIKKRGKESSEEEDIERGPAKELVFSDSEDDLDVDEDEQLPPGLHEFDLDDAPSDADSDMDEDDMPEDEFDLGEDDEEEEEEDSAFASSDDGEDDDIDMADEDERVAIGDDEDEDEEGRDGITTNLEDDIENEGFTLPAVDRGGEYEDVEHGTSLRDVEARMRWLVGVCMGKGEKAQGVPGKSRSDHLVQLQHDIATYFGYNLFLVEKLMKLFPADEALAFFEANESPRPVSIRANTLRTRRRDLAQALMGRGVNLEPIAKWSKVGLTVFESPVPIGATPEYLAGHYMLQSASSFLPVIALSPQPNERVLDMASAPGGKTTYISALLQNTGVVFANDSNKARTKSLTANVHRMGCKNVVVCNYDAREFPKVMGGFDRVLLDAPCSGTGVISKDGSVKVNKSERDFQLLSQLQKQLILCALDSCSPTSSTGGYVVYSTCSVTVDEDEAVVDYALKKRPNCHLVETGLEFGVEGFKSFEGKTFHPSVSLTRRFYPHKHNMDGFFVAKFRVEKRTKSQKNDTAVDAAGADITIDDDGAANGSAFNEAEDAAYIAEGKRKHLLKTKGIKVAPAEVEKSVKSPLASSGPVRIPKGKKVTEKRRSKA
ncbi:NOL1/NOP2/sun family-domain-containing protein [Kockovaella imperatae]|uniref:Nucleolar protein 2 n=1 Tax=Kockovaella imperatae TaxID=4999 RepID=A0A1Y1UP54_9TREE|nr:NOL1/NOP2/sun family-domain-containing protein [Kockovaella imperatae]ORX39811.1 NOL1/NOP2/sun family-domain-containing protein [Kockovaella imperatae]